MLFGIVCLLQLVVHTYVRPYRTVVLYKDPIINRLITHSNNIECLSLAVLSLLVQLNTATFRNDPTLRVVKFCFILGTFVVLGG